MKKSITLKIFFSIFVILCIPVISMADSEFFVPEYTEEYQEWLKLSEEEKKNVIEPQMYENPVDELGNSEIQTYSAENRMVGIRLPAQFSRNDYGEVRNQTTNLCWACSATTIFETNYHLTNRRNRNFSDLHMEYRTAKTYNQDGFNREYNIGGNINIALAYATNGMGIVEKGDITASNFKNAKSVAKVSDYEIISGANLKQYIYQQGVVSAYTCMDARYFSNPDPWHENNLAYYCSNSSAKANHAVTIIGWDDNYTNEAFPGQKGAYIVLNSYGMQFGNNGLYYIFYNDVFVKNADFYAVTKTEDISYDKLYQYDEYGETATIGWGLLEGGTYAANVFKKQTNDEEKLTELGIYFPATESLKIYINTNGDDKNINHADYVFTTATEKIGYHTIELPEPVTLKNQKFTVCVQYPTYMGAELAATDRSSWWYSISSNYGESYISNDGTNWVDLKETEALKGQPTNACIKAYTTCVQKLPDTPTINITNDNASDLINYVFDYRYYADHNLDLYQAFGYNQSSLKNHWEACGKAEGRTASCIFDGKYYLANNPDLMAAFGNNYLAAYQHFMTGGYREYRKSSLEYDGNYYKNQNSDLAKMSSMELIRHYALYGKNELRKASSNYDIVGQLFDYVIYGQMNPDLTATFGYNETRLKDHWLRYGIREGRMASLVFDAKYYLERNSDLKKAFGNNYLAAYHHFVGCGFQEQRQASPVFSIQYYKEHNADVRNSYGSNDLKILNHFVLAGKDEMRQTCSNFDVNVYKAQNRDLYLAYRNQCEKYYIHYAQYGRNEGRICK